MDILDLPQERDWDDYDWEAIFEPEKFSGHDFVPGDTWRTSRDDFPLIENVAFLEMYHVRHEGYDGGYCLALFWITGPDDCMWIDGSCDSTGWDCQSGVTVFFGTQAYLKSSVITRDDWQQLSQGEMPQGKLI